MTILATSRRAESDAGVRGALNLAGTEPEVVVAPDGLDADPYLLNCRNGVLDLRTGEICPHNPALLLTKITGASYRPDAQAHVFEKFLARVQPDEDMHGYLQRLLGHTLEGRQVVHILPIFYGEGGTARER